MSPVVAVNAPDVDDARRASARLAGRTVGHPLPGVVAKVVDPETGEGPLIGQEGLLLVNGPNRMQGYLGEPERTAEVAARRLVRDRRHRLHRRGRASSASPIALSRFSKIAGEMVPHMKVEEQIQALLDAQYTAS